MLKKNVLYLFIIILPFHPIFIGTILASEIPYINWWKEIIILFLFLFWIFSKQQSDNKYKLLIILIYLFTFYVSFISLINLNYDSFLLIKYYCLPLFLFIIFLNNPISEELKKTLLNTYVLVAVISVFFGIYQIYVLGTDYLLDIGYKSSAFSTHQISEAFFISGSIFQRMNSGFAGPIPFAIYIVSALLVELSLKRKSNFFKYLIISILIYGLYSSYLRSGMASLLIILFLFHLKDKIIANQKKSTLISVLLLIIIFTPIPKFILGNFSQNQLVFNIINLQLDASAIAHFNSYIEGFKIMASTSFFGFGPGFLVQQKFPVYQRLSLLIYVFLLKPDIQVEL